MKRIFCLLLALCLCLCLFAGCGETTPPVTSPEPTPEATPGTAPSEPMEPIGKKFCFTRDNMPRMDGSTSLVPLAQAAAATLLGESREEVEELVQFNRTSQSYRNLKGDFCDILIASVPSQDVYDELEAEAFEYEMQPIATDALVFVVNEGNPIDSLTTEQIIGIYTGEYTNWSELGGLDEPIAAFQRNSGAGSQALMEKLVMGDTPMMTPPVEFLAGSMGELMEYVKSYDNSAGAIGYSVYYYANDMRMADGLKIIAVDGVDPTDDNIRDGLYPHLSNYYTVIAADEPADSPARIMFEWLQSAEGQRLVQSEGYVPVKAYEDFDAAETSGGWFVETHGETLGGELPEGAKYTRLSEERIEALAARDDYGALYPFVGQVNVSEGGGEMHVYGLFDAQGRIVCDPVYAGVNALRYYVGGTELPVSMLQLVESVEESPGGWSTSRVRLASLDGSFVSPESYYYVRTFDFGVLCAETHSASGFTLYDFDGNVLLTEEKLKLGNLELESPGSIFDGRGGYLLAWLSVMGRETGAYLIAPDGSIVEGGWDSADFIGDGLVRVNTSEGMGGRGVVGTDGEWIIAPEYRNIILNSDGSFMCEAVDGFHTLFNADGSVRAEPGYGVRILGAGYLADGVFYPYEGESFALEGDWNSLGYQMDCPVIYSYEGDILKLLNVHSGKTLSFEAGEFGSARVELLMADYVTGPYSGLEYIQVWNGNGTDSAELISWDLEESYRFADVTPAFGTYSTRFDDYTGTEYIRVHNSDYVPGLYTDSLEPIAEAGEWDFIWNGCIVNTDDSFCTCTSPDGEVMFRYPLMPGGD